MKDYCVLVVLYKMNIDLCPTIQSLTNNAEHLANSTLVLWDNSPEPVSPAHLDVLKKKLPDVVYIYTPSNTSLSEIYNTVIRQYYNHEFLIFLDQDSQFTQEYFLQINKGRQQFSNINLFVPVIRHEGVIMSPGYYYYFKGKYRQNIDFGICSTRNMCVIASGMCVSFKYLKNEFGGFNEKLVFYGIDTFFSINYREGNEFFYVLDCPFDHSLSLTEDEQYETKLRRFDNHRKSLLILTENSGLLVKMICRLYILFESIKFRLKYLLRPNEKNS